MAPMNRDRNVEDLLAKLTNIPERDPGAALQGRARFLSQSREMRAAVSAEADQRHRVRTKNSTRMLENMKPRLLSALAAITLLAVVAIFVANTATTVSAQQVLDRAFAAELQVDGASIRHSRLEDYENPRAVEGIETGTTTIIEDYADSTNGYFRRVTRDSSGKILEIVAFDGAYSYAMKRGSASADGSSVIVERTPVSGTRVKGARTSDPAAAAKALFDNFRTNPRVTLEGKVTQADGRQAFVLVDQNYQTQKPVNGQNDKSYNGSTKMVFDAQTYELLQAETSVRINGKDLVIQSVRYLVNESLPTGSQVAWDLGDLKGVSYANQPAAGPNNGNVQVETISVQQLVAHTPTWLFKTMPAGFHLKITAVTNQPQDQPYEYELNYNSDDGQTFGMQAVGIMDTGFIETNFYDGSYKAASGLVLHYSTGGKGGTSAMLATPQGTSFLIISSLPRDRVQSLVEDLMLVK